MTGEEGRDKALQMADGHHDEKVGHHMAYLESQLGQSHLEAGHRTAQLEEAVYRHCGRPARALKAEVYPGSLEALRSWTTHFARVLEETVLDMTLTRAPETEEGRDKLSGVAPTSHDRARLEQQVAVWSCGMLVSADVNSFGQDDLGVSEERICGKKLAKLHGRHVLAVELEATGYAREGDNCSPHGILAEALLVANMDVSHISLEEVTAVALASMEQESVLFDHCKGIYLVCMALVISLARETLNTFE
ncbi:MAG: hypothetical protein Q9163_000593 [Psora crenata]